MGKPMGRSNRYLLMPRHTSESSRRAFLAGVEQSDLPAVVQLRLQLRRIDAPDVAGQS
jgi:hypothetical protein